MTAVTCTVGHASVERLKSFTETGWAEVIADDCSKAAEALGAAIDAIDHGGDLATSDREVIEAMIERDNVVGGSGFVADDLTELLALVEKRRQGLAIAPPPCTEEQLLTVPCPVCIATAGASCQRRPGEVLPLPQHHAERFWAASGSYSRPPALVPRVPEDALCIPETGGGFETKPVPPVATLGLDPQRACSACKGRSFQIKSDGPNQAWLKCLECGERQPPGIPTNSAG